MVVNKMDNDWENEWNNEWFDEDENGMIRGDIDCDELNYTESGKRVVPNDIWIEIDESDKDGFGWLFCSDDVGNVIQLGMKRPLQMLEEELKRMLAQE